VDECQAKPLQLYPLASIYPEDRLTKRAAKGAMVIICLGLEAKEPHIETLEMRRDEMRKRKGGGENLIDTTTDNLTRERGDRISKRR
jgi:hypothetical protein